MKNFIERCKLYGFKLKCEKYGLREVPLRVDGQVVALLGIE